MLPRAKTPKNQLPAKSLRLLCNDATFLHLFTYEIKAKIVKTSKLPAQNGQLFDNDDENLKAMPAITVDHF